MKPLLQMQLKEPFVLLQEAFTLQLLVSGEEHSSASEIVT